MSRGGVIGLSQSNDFLLSGNQWQSARGFGVGSPHAGMVYGAPSPIRREEEVQFLPLASIGM